MPTDINAGWLPYWIEWWSPAGQAGYGLVGLTCSALSTPFHPLVGHQFSLNKWPSTPETQGNYTFLQSNLAGKSPN